jgi:hypothetical protein
MSETMTPDNGSGNLTVNEAATAFEGILDAAEPSQEEQVEAVEESTEEVVEESTDEVEESTDEVEEVEESEEEEFDNPTYLVKASGEEREVTLDELIKSYQLGSDYTKKTQEVAEQRKAVEAERAAVEEAKQVRDTYSQRLQSLEFMLQQQNTETPEDMQKLKENDPIGYAVKIAEIAENKEKLAAIRIEQDRIAQQQQVEYSNQLRQRVSEEAQKLSQVLPEFSDKTKGEQIRSEIRTYGKAAGFTDEELSQVYDHRHVLVLYKAAQYDKLQKSKPQITKKVAEAPKMVKSGTKVTGKPDMQKKQMAKLKQSGRVADAAVLFENFI